MNKHIFQKEGGAIESEGIMPGSRKEESYFIQILQDAKNHPAGQVNPNHRKIIVLKIWTTSKERSIIWLEDSSIDNQSIPYLLGFVTNVRKGVPTPVLPDDIVAKLHEFMKDK